jgi:glycine oxidase
VGSYDVAIVGGGIIGGSIAFELAQQKRRVVLLDRQQHGREASWAAAGMLAPAPESQDSIALVPLATASLKLYPAFVAAVEAASGEKVGYRPDGTFVVFFPPEAERQCVQRIELHRRLGLAADSIAVEEAQLFEPALNPAATAVERLPDEASVDSRALTEAVLAAARGQGAELRAGAAVTALTIEKNRCTGVVAGGERIRAGQVVVAAGCYSGGIDPLQRFAPTAPVRGQMVALRSAKVRLGRALRSERGYLVPRNDGRIVAGSTLEHAGFEKNLTPAGLTEIYRAALELVPALSDAAVIETWCGLRPDTPDHLPVLGPTEIKGLSIATGHYRNGILLAPITAQLAREWLAEEKTSLPLEDYSPQRFSDPRKKLGLPAGD